MSGLYYTEGGLGTSLGIEAQPESPMAGAGLQNLGPSAADVYALQQNIQAGMLATIPPPPPPRTTQAPAGAFYSPSTDKMFAGGMAFDARDVQSAFQAAQQFSSAGDARPPIEVRDWQPLSRAGYEAYLSELRAPRGVGENLVLGARGAVGGLVSGVGRGLEMLGSTSVGPAIANVGEAITGQDEFDKQRSALIQQSNSTMSNILDAAVQGIPQLGMSLGAGVVGGIAGGAIGGPAGAAAGATAAATAANAGRALAAARTWGAVTGLAATSFPQQLNSIYEAARDARDAQGRPAYDVNDPTTKLTIAGAALGTSLLDMIAPGRAAYVLSRGLQEAAKEAGVKSLQGMARARAVGRETGLEAFAEAATEATQTLVERAVFDPELRRQLSAQDWKALGPYIVEKYGEDALIAAGAGAILGGGFGGAGKFIATSGPGSRERNLLDSTQTTAVGGPVGTQSDMFPGQDIGRPPQSQPLGGQYEMFPGMAPSYASDRASEQSAAAKVQELRANLERLNANPAATDEAIRQARIALMQAEYEYNSIPKSTPAGQGDLFGQTGLVPTMAPRTEESAAAIKVRELRANLDRLNADPTASDDAKRQARIDLMQAEYEYSSESVRTPAGQGSFLSNLVNPNLAGAVTALPPTGPQYGPLRARPTMPAPQVFPTRPTLAPETFVTPGMERLRRPIPEAVAPTTLGQTEAGNRLLALRRQMELQQAQAQAATQPRPLTAAERDYEAALAQQREQQAQQAIQQGVQLSPTDVMIDDNRGVNNARRNLIERFNGLTAAEQAQVLTAYGNNATVFEDAVKRMSITQVRAAQAYLSDPERKAPPLPYRGPSPAVQPAPAPAAPATAQGVEATWRSAEYDFPVRVLPEAPQTSPDGRKYQKVIGPEGRETYVPADELVYATPTPAPTVQETQTNAPEVRQVEQGGVGQRADVSGRLASQGADRNVPTQDQEAGGQAGGGNRAEQGRAPQAKGVVATLRDEGIELTTEQRRSLNEAEKKIKRYRALLNCLRTP